MSDDGTGARTMTDRVAIVTGGSRGIGRRAAMALSATGCAVVLGYVQNDSEADSAVAELSAGGGSAISVQGDIGESTDVTRLFDAAEHKFGGVDVVVNAAGIIGTSAPVADSDLGEFDQIMRTNVRGTFAVAQEAARRLRAGGTLITISSSATRYSRVGSAAYTMSKGAVESLTLILARELRGRDITVNTVAPGVIGTELFERFLQGRPEVRAELVASSPMNRLGTPGDIAAVIGFLASPAGRWVNGQVIYVNGGGMLAAVRSVMQVGARHDRTGLVHHRKLAGTGPVRRRGGPGQGSGYFIQVSSVGGRLTSPGWPPRPGPHRGAAGRAEGPHARGARAEPSAGGYGSAPLSSSPRPATHRWGPTSTPGSWPRSRRAGCQASPDPWASVRPIATSAHPARCLTERRRRGTWRPCRRADLRSSLSRGRASTSIMYGCIVFTYRVRDDGL
jgi:3-oxoacyl-[acyl-carrier protein] reductase